MKLKEAVARIEELEKRVRELEARPTLAIGQLFQSPPWPLPVLYVPPVLPYMAPLPGWLPNPPWIVTCTAVGTGETVHVPVGSN